VFKQVSKVRISKEILSFTVFAPVTSLIQWSSARWEDGSTPEPVE
jgi:hypothetical protein